MLPGVVGMGDDNVSGSGRRCYMMDCKGKETATMQMNVIVVKIANVATTPTATDAEYQKHHQQHQKCTFLYISNTTINQESIGQIRELLLWEEEEEEEREGSFCRGK